jgi:hypothetical protein
MKKYSVKIPIKFLGLRQGDILNEREFSYEVASYISFSIPIKVIENNPEYFEEIKEEVCKECGRPLDR